MKVVILAAGQGSRLGDQEHPKPLVPLEDGQSILAHQIHHVRKHVSIDDIFLVVGFRKELFLEAFPDLLFVYSPYYARENTSKSLLRAVKKIDEDLLWINADVVFHPYVLSKLLENRRNAMLVSERKVGEEEVKYKSDSSGHILEVSKSVVDGTGEALGLNFFTAESLPSLQKHLTQCHDDDYFEKAIEGCIQEGMKVHACPIDSDLCTEIDFPEDLKHASGLLRSWKI